MSFELIMDQRRRRSMSPSSYYFFHHNSPSEQKQEAGGYWDPPPPGTKLHHHVGNNSVPSSTLEKLTLGRTQAVEFLEFHQPILVREQVARLSLEQKVVGAENTTNLSVSSWRSVDHGFETRSNKLVQPASYFNENNKTSIADQYDNGLFSSSLSEVFSKTVRLPTNNVLCRQSIEAVTSHYEEEEPFVSLEEVEARTIGNLLPDDEDLLSGVVDYEVGYATKTNIVDDVEDFDIFSSGGGMELEEDDCLNSSRCLRNPDFSRTNSTSQQDCSNISIAGKYPYSEHPSRTLFVRNINSDIEDSELKALFEKHGDIRTLYTACKHRGFAMISYYDIRAACDATRALQNKPLRRRNLDIHFSIPKDTPSEKDTNQDTLVVLNLEFSVSNDELHRTFGAYGDIKEIHENPYKRHCKLIEFYDVRAAEAALCSLNRSEIAGKQIRVEPSHPRSAAQCLALLSSHEIEQGDSTQYIQRGSPPNSTPGLFSSVSYGAITSHCMDSVQSLHSSIGKGVPISHFVENGFHHSLPPSVPQLSPSSMVLGPSGSQSGLGEPSITLGQVEFGFQHMPPFHPNSFPDYHDGLASGVPYSSGTMATYISSRAREGITNGHVHRVGLSGHAIEPNDRGSGNGSCLLHGEKYVWSNSNFYRSHPAHPLMWTNLPSFVNGANDHPSSQQYGFSRLPSQMMNTVLPKQHHHVGSAPTVIPSLWNKLHIYERESHGASSFHPDFLGSTELSGNSSVHQLELNCNIFPHGGGNCMDMSLASTSVGLHLPQQRYHMLPRRNSISHMAKSYDSTNERVIRRRSEVTLGQAENKKLFDLNIDLILHGEDTRTTLMIKNIPNKYTSKMLLAAIDEHHRGTYDFIYLPIDFKNKCNVGYAFINMINPSQIVPFYQAFNGKKWEKFNSEKVASLAYARIQGKVALISHFQNSSLMNEDKRCRPILFQTNGPNAGDQEPFPMGANIRSRTSKSRANSNDEYHLGSSSTCDNGEQASNITDSSSGSARDSE